MSKDFLIALQDLNRYDVCRCVSLEIHKSRIFQSVIATLSDMMTSAMSLILDQANNLIKVK